MEPQGNTGSGISQAVASAPKKRKRRKAAASGPGHEEPRPSAPKLPVLWWKREPHVPLASEEAMIPVLLQWGAKERGMMKDQPPFRLPSIQKRLKQVGGMKLEQALSLRRHHMKLQNPYRDMPTLRLGKVEDINASAEVFERIVEVFLKENNIPFLNETDQRNNNNNNDTNNSQASTATSTTLTPDFLLPTPVRVKLFRQQESKGKRVVVREVSSIHWIEAKMFYGASTIPSGSAGAVGLILPKVKRYVEQFGEGAIIFMHGCGDHLANQLAAEGVTALSAAGLPKRLLNQVWDHQRTWCAREDGMILP